MLVEFNISLKYFSVPQRVLQFKDCCDRKHLKQNQQILIQQQQQFVLLEIMIYQRSILLTMKKIELQYQNVFQQYQMHQIEGLIKSFSNQSILSVYVRPIFTDFVDKRLKQKAKL